MNLNKFGVTLGLMSLLTLLPTLSFAKWTIQDQANKANNAMQDMTKTLQNGGSVSSDGTSSSSGGGYGGPLGAYIYIPFRQNDVFVFCKEGPNTKSQDYYWIVQNGVFTITNYYAYVYSTPSWVSTVYWNSICPFGKKPNEGTWQGTGSPGDYKGNTSPQVPLLVPFIH